MEAIGFWEYAVSWFKSNLLEKPLVVDIDLHFLILYVTGLLIIN